MIQGKKRLKSIGNEATLEAFFSRVFPYLLLLFASFIPFAIYFRSGMDFPSGMIPFGIESGLGIWLRGGKTDSLASPLPIP